MWNNKKKQNTSGKIDSLIGANTQVQGDVAFQGGLHIDGRVVGNVIAEDVDSTLILSSQGHIEGDVHVAHVMLNGTVKGNVYSTESVELASEAHVEGNVFYNLLEMEMGAEVNGNLVHQSKSEQPSQAKEQKQQDVVESTVMGYLDEKNAPN